MMRWFMKQGRSAAWGTLAIMLTSGLAVSGADPNPSLREVVAQLAAQSKQIESLEVEYKLDTRSPLKPAQLRALPDFHNQVFLPHEHWTEAFKGVKRYRHLVQPERVVWLAPVDEYGLTPPEAVDPKAPAAIQESQKQMKAQYDRAIAMMKAEEARGVKLPRRNPSLLPERDRDVTRGYNGRSLWVRYPGHDQRDVLEVWPARSKPNFFQLSAYLAAVGMHQPDPTMEKEPDGPSMFQLATWLEKTSYTVADQTETIDGATCLVLKGDVKPLEDPSTSRKALTDTLWLDRDHGLAVRKRDMACKGQLAWRWENAELKEVAPGLWMPFHCRRETFSPEAPPEFQGKPVLTVEIDASRIEINHVPDDLFDMETKPNDLVQDLRGGR